MSPVWMIEGTKNVDPATEQRVIAQHRFSALAAAVREHEAMVRRREYAVRPQDNQLYRRLRQICGQLG